MLGARVVSLGYIDQALHYLAASSFRPQSDQ